MIAKRPGAYKYAHKKNEIAEDKYFKALSDIDRLEIRLQSLNKHSAKVHAVCADFAVEYANHQINKQSEAVTERLHVLQSTLKNYVDSFPLVSGASIAPISEALAGFSANTQQLLKDVCIEAEKQKIITLGRKLNSILPTETSSASSQLLVARRDSDEALCQVCLSFSVWECTSSMIILHIDGKMGQARD